MLRPQNLFSFLRLISIMKPQGLILGEINDWQFADELLWQIMWIDIASDRIRALDRFKGP